jgi:peptidoglycan/LPS O-acetylase OafA/YrhL
MSATHLRLDALLFGVGIRAVAQYLPDRFRAVRPWRVWLTAAGLALWSLHLLIEPTTVFIRTIGLTATYLGAAAFLLAAYHTHADDFGRWKVLVSPLASAVAWVGVYSYAIYLWHVTALGIASRVFGDRFMALIGTRSQSGWLVAMVGVTTAAVVAGVVASKVVEWPVLRLRDRFFPSRSGPLPVSGVVPSSSEDAATRTTEAAVEAQSA